MRSLPFPDETGGALRQAAGPVLLKTTPAARIQRARQGMQGFSVERGFCLLEGIAEGTLNLQSERKVFGNSALLNLLARPKKKQKNTVLYYS